MSIAESLGEPVSDISAEGSRTSACTIQISEADSARGIKCDYTAESINMKPLMRNFIQDYDSREAFRYGYGNSCVTDLFSEEISDSRTITEGDISLDTSKSFEEWLRHRLNLLKKLKKIEHINQIISALSPNQEMQVYPARKPLPSGENATWDISNGEERTQPRRVQYPRVRRQRAQRASSSSDAGPIQTRSQNSIHKGSSQSDLQVPWSTEKNTDLNQMNYQVGLGSNPMCPLTSITQSASENFSLRSPHNGSARFNELDAEQGRYPPMFPLPIATSSATMYQTTRVILQPPIPELSTRSPDIFSNGMDFGFADELAAGTRNYSSSRSNDTMTSSSRSGQSPFSTPLSSSTPPRHNPDLYASREPDFSPSPVETSDAAPGVDNRVISVQLQKERSDDDPDWFQDFIHDYMLEPSSE